MKGKKSDIIKNCLKRGIPTAALVGSMVGMTCGCGDDNAETKPTERRMPVVKEVKKLAFDDSDFTKNFSKLSASGKKKLNRFVENISRKHAEILYSRGKDGSTLELEFTWGKAGESDANKRKKARTVFKRFSYVYVSLAGKVLTSRRIVDEKIAETIDKEFSFRADKSK